MPLSTEQQSLFDHAKSALPRLLFGAIASAREWLYAYAVLFDAVRSQGAAWLDQTFIATATGRFLEQHAKDRGTSRRASESDATLRSRLYQVEDALTDPAIKIGVNAILAAAGVAGTCAIVDLRRDKAFLSPVPPTTTRAFLSRGYRMSYANRPMGYVVILPYGTTAQTANAVSEYLRQFGPAGYYAIVERRLNP